MTRYTVMLFQEAYPEQIRIDRHKNEKTGKINIECYLLNEDKTPHMLLFDGGNFPDNEAVDKLVQKILEIELT